MLKKTVRLALTPGDPTGIGPEITVKVLERLHEYPPLDLLIIGSLKALEKAAERLGLCLPQGNAIRYVPIEHERPGAVAYEALTKAVELIRAGEATSLVTGPISKHHLKEAGHLPLGHTEILEDLTKRFFKIADAKSEMLFVYKNLRLLLLTRHIALTQVSKALAEKDAVLRPLDTLIAFLQKKVGIKIPELALLAVNPHAGEVGGDEENNLFLPVMEGLNHRADCHITGPYPADGFFRGFNPEASPYDAIVASYHDQGLIPFKLLAGYEAVNVTIGLPFLRTSVSHGTAADIAGKGLAREDSLMAALHLALDLM